MGIVYVFHVLVDGWLTKLSAPIVIYDDEEITGLRIPWDIPVEDYLFGFSMITLTLSRGSTSASASPARPATRSRAGIRTRHEHRRPHDRGDSVSPDAQSTDRWVLADAFDRAAPTYDAMVALSPGYHDQLATAAGALVDRLPRPEPGTDSLVVLDLGCGSGASTRAVLDAWAARAGAATPSPCRGSTPPRAWSRRPARSRGRARSSSSSRMPWHTSSRSRTGRSTACSPRTSCATCPTAAPRARGGPRAAPGRRGRRPRLLRGRQRPRTGDLGGGLPRHHHPAGRRQALRRAAAPVPLRERARLRLGGRHLRAPPVRRARRRQAPLVRRAGSTASCTPSSGRHRRDPRAPQTAVASGAGPTGGLPPAAGAGGRSGGPDAVPPGSRHVVVVGGGIAGLTAALGLAERGIRVTLLEREAGLGGRVRSWPVDIGGDRGR